MKRRLSWKPKLNGEQYCSPACGAGCTIQEHDRAVRDAHRLARRLGDKWTMRVWENLGWHYTAVSPCGQLEIYHFGKNRFWADFHGPRQVEATGPTPHAALRKVLSKVQELEKAFELLRAGLCG